MDISKFYLYIRKILENYLEEEIGQISDEKIEKIREKYKNGSRQNKLSLQRK
jgi:hypothetical protein